MDFVVVGLIAKLGIVLALVAGTRHASRVNPAASPD